MKKEHNTLFLRLAGPMQSWGTGSRSQIRRTDGYPSKSGVLGLLLCAKGVHRECSQQALLPLGKLLVGVRVDQPGVPGWDYHTAGAKIGNRQAKGGIKLTASTGEPETQLSRRQYLYDASFLVALHGEPATIADCAAALEDPIWPIFLGRKCCIPSEPVLVGTDTVSWPDAAMQKIPWRSRGPSDWDGRERTRVVETFIEHPQGSPPPDGALLVNDVPRIFGYDNHGSRWIVPGQLTVATDVSQSSWRQDDPWRDPYGPEWEALKAKHLEKDENRLCVFCKSPAVEVHHTNYRDVRLETIRSLCRICHDACTNLEYARGCVRRVDPSDPAQREELLTQIDRLVKERRRGRRRELLAAGRGATDSWFDDAPGAPGVEDR